MVCTDSRSVPRLSFFLCPPLSTGDETSLGTKRKGSPVIATTECVYLQWLPALDGVDEIAGDEEDYVLYILRGDLEAAELDEDDEIFPSESKANERHHAGGSRIDWLCAERQRFISHHIIIFTSRSSRACNRSIKGPPTPCPDQPRRTNNLAGPVAPSLSPSRTAEMGFDEATGKSRVIS